MLFVTSVYGNEYVPFLTVCLDSILKEHGNDKVVVLWDDIRETEIQLLQYWFRSVEFKKQEHRIFHKDIRKRVSSKLNYWIEVSERYEEDVICFLDTDMLVYKNIQKYTEDDFDLLYTWKDEKFPLNTGVIIVKNSEKIRSFFKMWLKYTEDIINDDKLLAVACQKSGAADQQALLDLMNLSSYQKGCNRSFEFGTISFRGVSCDELNQTKSVPVNCGSSIFHYKGGWHPILLKEEDFSKNRPKHTSLEMKCFWENRYADINEALLKDFVITSSKKYSDILEWDKIEHETRGILHSEMLAVISVIKELGVDVIIESGRCRGQSTFILAEAFKKDNIPIVSIEWFRDENSEFAEKRLEKYQSVKLLYGDAHKLMPEIVSQYSDKKIAILFDGPKGKDAFNLFSNVISKNSNIVAGFFHDCRKSYRKMINPARDEISRYFDRIFFTDDEDYVGAFSFIDKNCIVPEYLVNEDSFRPYLKGFNHIGSYGPTLSVVLPTDRDKARWRKFQANEKLSEKILSKIKNLLRNFKGL